MRRSLLGGMIAAIARSYRRRRAVAHLSELNDHLLRDIGIERNDIRRVVDGVDALENLTQHDKTASPQVIILQPMFERRATR